MNKSEVETTAETSEKRCSPHDKSTHFCKEPFFTFCLCTVPDLEKISVYLLPVNRNPAHPMETTDQESRHTSVKDRFIRNLLAKVSNHVPADTSNCQFTSHCSPQRHFLATSLCALVLICFLSQLAVIKL